MRMVAGASMRALVRRSWVAPWHGVAVLALVLLAGCQGSRDTLVAVYEGNAVMHVENGSNPPSYFIVAMPATEGGRP
jgi:hypothetical protein